MAAGGLRFHQSIQHRFLPSAAARPGDTDGQDLPFGLLQAGVLVGVDLREAVQLLPQGADLFFQLVALAAFGPLGPREAVVVSGWSSAIGPSST